MLFPVTLLTLAGAFAVVRTTDGRRSGIRFGLYFWIVSAGLAALPVLVYRVDYSLKVDLFIAACLAAIVSGYKVVRRPSQSPPEQYWRKPVDYKITVALGWAGVIGSLLLLFNAFQSGISISPLVLIQNLDEIRANSLGLADAGGFSGPYALLGSFLSPCGFLYLVLITRVRGSRTLALANFALIVFVAFAYYGGRQTIIVAVLLVIAAFWLRGVKILRVNLRTGVLLVLTLAVGWYFVTTFADQRKSPSDESTASLLRISGRAEYPSWLKQAAETNPTLGSSMLQFSYFSTPLISLSYYMQQDSVPDPLLGQYSFPLPAQLMATYLGEDNAEQWQKARREVFRPFTSGGYLDNAWASGLRDLVADFSAWGAVVFYFLLGAMMAWARNRYERTGGAYYHALEVYTAVIFGFGAFQSLVYTDYTSYGVFIAWGVVILQSARTRSRRAAEGRARTVGMS